MTARPRISCTFRVAVSSRPTWARTSLAPRRGRAFLARPRSTRAETCPLRPQKIVAMSAMAPCAQQKQTLQVQRAVQTQLLQRYAAPYTQRRAIGCVLLFRMLTLGVRSAPVACFICSSAHVSTAKHVLFSMLNRAVKHVNETPPGAVLQ